MAQEIMTAEEAARYLRVGVDALKRKARGGDIPAAKIGRAWRFRKADLDAWLALGGDRYEELVDQGLVEATRKAMAEGGDPIPWEQVKERLGL